MVGQKRSGSATSQAQSKRAKTSDPYPVEPSDAFGFESDNDFDNAIEEALEKKPVRKGGVNVAGYDSDQDLGHDSDDDDDDERKEEQDKEDGNDEEDMFAEPAPKKVSWARKDLDAAEEEGPDDSDNVVRIRVNAEDEDDNETKEVPIVGFNMREEMEEGDFNEVGTYVTKHDEDKHHDNWLTGISSKDIKKAAEAKSRVEATARERAREVAERAKKNVDDLLYDLFTHLQPRETLTKALKRMGGSLKKSKSTTESKNKEAIEKVTEIANELMGRGYFSVYDDTYESLKRHLERIGKLTEPKAVEWQYKWTQNSDAEVFGPFSSDQMKMWRDGSYFSQPIWVAQVGSNVFLPLADVQLEQ